MVLRKQAISSKTRNQVSIRSQTVRSLSSPDSSGHRLEVIVRRLETCAIRKSSLTVTMLLLIIPLLLSLRSPGMAQRATAPSPSANNDESTTSAVRDLQEQVELLRRLVEEMRVENSRSRMDMQQLRQELQDTLRLLADRTGPPAIEANSSQPSEPAGPVRAKAPLEDRIEKLEESTSLLDSKVNEQDQTKVETASRYRARLSGIVLMNAFRNQGSSNNADLPDFAEPVLSGASQSSVGATLRQSQIGVEIFGPDLANAKTSANIQFDFFGGFPATGNGVNFGLARLQTASLHLDWEHTSVVAGQDSLFFSPLSPTSFASLATPAFGYAGNLWGWTPQLRVERRFDIADQQTLTIQAGVIDNLDWEPSANQFYRTAQAGELSGQPAYAVRTSWSRSLHDRPMSVGVAGYYGRQDWSWDRYVDAWAGMADWRIPVLHRLEFSGEFYRGRGIGGLGAGVGRSILYGGNPNDNSTPIRGLNSAGGWGQLKLQLSPRLELNAAVSEDNSFAGDMIGFATDQNNFGTILGRNRGALANFVYRPRSDLLFSAEFRRLESFPVYSSSSTINQVNLAMGILF